MDSLTQIILGAAAGEVVLGKKIGNRAMVWGAVGGTIPDLDVLGKFFLSEIDNLAFHRGISHSILFSVLGAFVFGWLIYNIYKSPYHRWIAVTCKVLAMLLIVGALNFVFERIFPDTILPTALIAIVLSTYVYFNVKKSYFSGNWAAPDASLRDWQKLFFWSLVTHPILDCFTMYGTQLFAPFSDVRVAWATISVADPLYTLPFLICLLVAARYSRKSSARRVWNYMGIALSSAYLLFTVFNKQRIDRIFADALAKQKIPVERFISNSSILNNILWNCTAESSDAYYLTQYSLFDKSPIKFTKIDKNHSLLKNKDSDPTVKTLRWFSDDYYTVNRKGNGYQFSDLRFGTFSGEAKGADDYIFRFFIEEKSDQSYEMQKVAGGPPDGKSAEIMGGLWARIMGK